jgi:hypothetical protein
MITRRSFLRSSTATVGTMALAGPLVGLQLGQAAGARPRPDHGYGPLAPTGITFAIEGPWQRGLL